MVTISHMQRGMSWTRDFLDSGAFRSVPVVRVIKNGGMNGCFSALASSLDVFFFVLLFLISGDRLQF